MLAFTGILTLASIMLLIGPINYFQKHLPVPVSLDLASSFSVAKEAVWERPFWGTGPQALVEAISRHRPDSFFSSTIWNLRFIKVGNEWLTLLASLGLGGWLAFIWLIISFIRKIWPAISRATDGDEDFSVRLGIILAWLALTGASFFIPFSLILYFAWWLLFSLALSSVFVWSKNNNPIEIDLLRSRPVLLVTLFSGAIILITLVVVGFFGQRFIRAGLIFFRAQQSIIAQQDAAPILSDMRQAAALNPYEPQYQISLAQGYGAQALLLSGQATPDQTQIQAQTQKVIDSLNEAKKLSVLSAYVYEQEAAVYQSLFSLISNADQLAAEAYANALLIEPNNPLLLLNLGRAKLFEAQVIKKDDSQNSQAAGLVDEAVSSLTRALAIKKDLPIIQLSLSAAYLEKGDYEAAKTNLDQLIAANANDRDARWLLANVYEQQSLFDLALAELEILKAQQPENQTILDKIKEVEGKKMVPAEQ
ncbi:MAG: hypothetical protein UY81_C0065G0005 [Candidatus Giovannonibacteria bacterium GW2011_GWA2_53_7]|uniref:Uncharacterized protein n=1 Tax=Candidatus Giovannonibacteria bacterium GW2011_GWA2_53_7 TaxID=1618650 RepID=A0A0G1XUT4_9BACT|nr:MAG: hypothetical protein UY81_C0065G0005 [Candidatus Giovannonibacteria bacterium GW2011_GWA2_53_7]